MPTTSLRRTTRCRVPIAIGDAWLCVEHIYREEEGAGAVVAYRDPSRPSPHGSHFFRGACVRLGERRELLPGIHVTVEKRSTRHRIALRIEAPSHVPITSGFPRQRGPRLVHSAI